MTRFRHWADDPYWADDVQPIIEQLRKSGTFTLDFNKIEASAFKGDGPAYKLMEAMVSVWQNEGDDGYRGAPRVFLALLARLAELSESKNS